MVSSLGAPAYCLLLTASCLLPPAYCLLLTVLCDVLCEVMKKRTTPAQRGSTGKAKKVTKPKPSREYIQSLRGKYRGQGLMKELLAEKKREREL